MSGSAPEGPAVPKKQKPGKVIRVDELTFRFLAEKRRRGEPVTALVRRLLGLPSRSGICETQTKYVLPSDLHETVEDARGAAVLRAVKQKKKEAEEPRPIREVV